MNSPNRNAPAKRTRTLLKSTFAAGSMTTVSRITGLARDVIFAHLIGSTAVADAFFVAFRIPNFFRRIFGEGAFSAAFVPVYAKQRLARSPKQTRNFVNLVTGWLGLSLIVLVAAGVVAAPMLITGLAPGFKADPVKYQLTVDSLRITFPYLLFISMVALSAGILNTQGYFAAPAATPILLNLSLIAAAVWVTGMVDNAAIALSIGVFAAGAIQLLFQLPFLARVGAVPLPRLRIKDDAESGKGAKEVFRLMLPALFGTSIAQLNLIVNTFIASFLVTGSVSWLYYSDRLMEFPLGVFGVALGTVILPRLSTVHARLAAQEFSDLLDWGLRWCFLIGLPSTVGLITLAEPMLATLFLHGGAFTEFDVTMSARALVAYATGLLGLIAVRVLSPGFFARNNTKTPVHAGAISMAVNAVLAVALAFSFQHVGLAMATSIAAYVNAGILLALLMKQGAYAPNGGWPLFLLRVGGASLIMGAVLWWSVADSSMWYEYGAFHRAIHLLMRVLAGAAIYIACLYLFGVRIHQLMRK